jgi:L-lactate dehydrogenase
MIKDNSKIMKIIARSIKESGFQGFTIIVSNPVELLTTVYLKETMFKQEKVIGAGTVLDAMRLKYLLMKRFNQKSNKINDLYVLGEHGDDIIIDWEKVSVNNEKLNDLLQKEDKNEFGKKIILKKLEEETMKRAYKIIKNKGATYLGIGASISKIVDILNNNLKEEVLNVSVYHEDIDLYLSWPVKIDQEKEKIEKLDLKLDQEKIWNQEKKLSDLKLKLKTIFKENN